MININGTRTTEEYFKMNLNIIKLNPQTGKMQVGLSLNVLIEMRWSITKIPLEILQIILMNSIKNKTFPLNSSIKSFILKKIINKLWSITVDLKIQISTNKLLIKSIIAKFKKKKKMNMRNRRLQSIFKTKCWKKILKSGKLEQRTPQPTQIQHSKKN